MGSLSRIEDDIQALEQTIRSMRTSASGCSTSSGENHTVCENRFTRPDLCIICETDSEDEPAESRFGDEKYRK